MAARWNHRRPSAKLSNLKTAGESRGSRNTGDTSRGPWQIPYGFVAYAVAAMLGFACAFGLRIGAGTLGCRSQSLVNGVAGLADEFQVLERTKKVQKILLARVRKHVKSVDDGVCLRGGGRGVRPTAMRLNGFYQIRGAAVMQKENSLAESPQRRCAKFVRPRLTLRYVVPQLWSHMMNREIRIKVGFLLAQCGDRGLAGG
jgi:hypothetical protein